MRRPGADGDARDWVSELSGSGPVHDQAIGSLLAALCKAVMEEPTAHQRSSVTCGEVERIRIPYAAWVVTVAAVHRPV